MRCEDYPCCGHTPQDPCERQPYDEPGYYDTSIPGQEHRLCDHENGECDVDEPEEDEDEGDDGSWLADAMNREAEESMLGRPLFPNEY